MCLQGQYFWYAWLWPYPYLINYIKLLHLSCYLVILPLADPPILYLSTIVDTHIPYLLSRDKPSLR